MKAERDSVARKPSNLLGPFRFFGSFGPFGPARESLRLGRLYCEC